MDIVLVNGELKKGDTIVIAGQGGPIVTQIRALLTPKPMKELRVKGEYINHPKINTSMGIKIVANGLGEAQAGASLRLCRDPNDLDALEDLKEQVDDEFHDVVSDLSSLEKEDVGVYVQASTLGSLEALLSFLKSMEIPVCQANIGIVHKKDVKKAAIMREKGKPEYAVILAFDVKVDADAVKEAARPSIGVKIFSADIIYHLKDQFAKYMDEIKDIKKRESANEVVFPTVLRICSLSTVFRKKDPMILGVDILEGTARIGTPLCVPEVGNLEIGRIDSIEKDRKAVEKAKKGESVTVRIQPNALQSHIMLGRHFSITNPLYSRITRDSIDTLKEHYADEMTNEDWKLVVNLKKVFGIQ